MEKKVGSAIPSPFHKSRDREQSLMQCMKDSSFPPHRWQTRKNSVRKLTATGKCLNVSYGPGANTTHEPNGLSKYWLTKTSGYLNSVHLTQGLKWVNLWWVGPIFFLNFNFLYYNFNCFKFVSKRLMFGEIRFQCILFFPSITLFFFLQFLQFFFERQWIKTRANLLNPPTQGVLSRVMYFLTHQKSELI